MKYSVCLHGKTNIYRCKVYGLVLKSDESSVINLEFCVCVCMLFFVLL